MKKRVSYHKYYTYEHFERDLKIMVAHTLYFRCKTLNSYRYITNIFEIYLLKSEINENAIKFHAKVK